MSLTARSFMFEHVSPWVEVVVYYKEGETLNEEESKKVADFAINKQALYGDDCNLEQMADDDEDEEMLRLLDKVKKINVDWPTMPDQTPWSITK